MVYRNGKRALSFAPCLLLQCVVGGWWLVVGSWWFCWVQFDIDITNTGTRMQYKTIEICHS
jgi:hypothetical protein